MPSLSQSHKVWSPMTFFTNSVFTFADAMGLSLAYAAKVLPNNKMISGQFKAPPPPSSVDTKERKWHKFQIWLTITHTRAALIARTTSASKGLAIRGARVAAGSRFLPENMGRIRSCFFTMR